ncbi:MAG: hypothetical protein HY286_15820 [Planctomycetes bacterium]|nr:hypothetical protein [Planctomycetota bacterium]
MATKPTSTAEADTTEESAAPAASNFEVIYLTGTVIFLILAIVIMLMAAGKHFNAGVFKSS